MGRSQPWDELGQEHFRQREQGPEKGDGLASLGMCLRPLWLDSSGPP